MTITARMYCTVTLCLLAFICDTGLSEAPDAIRQFRKVQLSDEYFAEGASFGDFNNDGHRDLVAGPFWFAGPTFEKRHRFYDGKAFPNDRGYSDNFFSFAYDFSGDGWDDVLVVGLPGTPAFWYENSHGQDLWKKHLAFPRVDNEAPAFEDLTGDGVPELICTFEGRLGYAAPHPAGSEREWQWHPVSEKGSWHRFSHGLGCGDIDGDGRTDFLMPTGWWQQPSEGTATIWPHHPYSFCPGGAQLYAFDIDEDGDQDVVTSLNAHAWGLSWFEQVAGEDGAITFRPHKIMGEKPEENPSGVAFSQLHAVDCVDVDGDGRRDIVTGKCYWAHNGNDPGARDPAVVYWFRNTVHEGKIRFVPQLVDDDSGVGRQVRAADMNGDGRTDIMSSNKKGTFLFLQTP